MRGLLWILLAGLALGQSNGLQAEDPWATVFSGDSAEVYLVLHNPTSQPLRIVAVESPLFQQIEFKNRVQDSGDHLPLAQRYYLQKVDHLELEANGTLRLEPNGLRITLGGPKPGQQIGSIIPLTLVLGDGQTLNIVATPRK